MLLLSDNHHLKLGNGGQKIVGVGAVKGEERSLDPSARGIILAVVFARIVIYSGCVAVVIVVEKLFESDRPKPKVLEDAHLDVSVTGGPSVKSWSSSDIR